MYFNALQYVKINGLACPALVFHARIEQEVAADLGVVVEVADKCIGRVVGARPEDLDHPVRADSFTKGHVLPTVQLGRMQPAAVHGFDHFPGGLLDEHADLDDLSGLDRSHEIRIDIARTCRMEDESEKVHAKLCTEIDIFHAGHSADLDQWARHLSGPCQFCQLCARVVGLHQAGADQDRVKPEARHFLHLGTL